MASGRPHPQLAPDDGSSCRLPTVCTRCCHPWPPPPPRTSRDSPVAAHGAVPQRAAERRGERHPASRPACVRKRAAAALFGIHQRGQRGVGGWRPPRTAAERCAPTRVHRGGRPRQRRRANTGIIERPARRLLHRRPRQRLARRLHHAAPVRAAVGAASPQRALPALHASAHHDVPHPSFPTGARCIASPSRTGGVASRPHSSAVAASRRPSAATCPALPWAGPRRTPRARVWPC